MSKVHIHEDQFDGAWHPHCGRGEAAVGDAAFEATDPQDRCSFCSRYWFPYGQPDWHLKASKESTHRSNSHE